MRIAICVVLVAACQQGKGVPQQQNSTPPAGGSAVASKLTPPGRPVPPLPDPLPGKRRDITDIVGKAQRIALGDGDGDGKLDIVLVDPKQLRIVDHAGKELGRADAPGGIQVLTVGDVDGDGRADILAGWGETRERRGAKAQVTLHHLHDGALASETVVVPQTTRQDVTAIEIVGKNELAVAYFTDKYNVTSVTAKHEGAGWMTSGGTAIRLAVAWGRGDLDGDGHPDVVVGRPYGDAVGVDGDVFVLGADGKRTQLPTTRGVQTLAVADVDGDGRAEVIAGDGWHMNYGQLARGLVTLIRNDGGAYKSELIEDTPGQYVIWQIVVADVDGDHVPEIVTRGSHYVRVYRRANPNGAWRGLTIYGVARDLAVGDLDGTGNVIVIAGDRSAVVDLHGATW